MLLGPISAISEIYVISIIATNKLLQTCTQQENNLDSRFAFFTSAHFKLSLLFHQPRNSLEKGSLVAKIVE